MKVLLFQLDGKIPNIALMRLAQHHRERGDDVELRRTGQPEQMLFGGFAMPHLVYASAIFRTSINTAERARRAFPTSVLGGTAVDPSRKGEPVFLSPVISPTITDHKLGDGRLDYSLYPDFKQSIGFTQRGCRLNCEFCVVRPKEGPAHEVQDIPMLWRGGSAPRELILLDNDFFGQPNWRTRIGEIRDGKFKVDFNQGINARFIDDEAAEAIASVDYRHLRNGSMKVRRIFTAWDNRKDEQRLFAGLNRLVKYGIKPDHIEVYMLIGYWPGETMEDCDYRRRRLREFGARPYPMPFRRTTELVGFQRFVVGAYDKRFSWKEWSAANCRPEKLNQPTEVFEIQ
jgi:hypothetical protein